MSKAISPRVTPFTPTGGVEDASARAALRALSQAWQTRNGETEARFATREELKEVRALAERALALVSELSSQGTGGAK